MDFTGEVRLGFIMHIWRVRVSRWLGCGPPIGRVMVAQKVTLPSLWGEQAAIWIDGPSPATGEGNGEGADTPWLPWERICAQYGRCFASFVSSTASDRKGFVKGDSVPLDRVLPTFARTKVGPCRVGVQVMPLQKAPRRRRRLQTGPTG